MGTNRVAVITGAASGIGRASAQKFAENGYALGLVDISAEIGPVAAELSRLTAVKYVKADVADEAAMTAFLAEVHGAFGRVDVLNNNAGIVVVKPLTDTTLQEFMEVTRVNFGGTFLMTKAVIPYMKAQGSGAIVNLGSISGHVGQTQHAVYGGTKGAVLAFTKAMAWELADDHIRVNSVSPGSVDTPMLRADVQGESVRLQIPYAQLKKEREAEQAFQRWAEPAEIAAAIFFLASGEASFITGTDLLVDCGWAAK